MNIYTIVFTPQQECRVVSQSASRGPGNWRLGAEENTEKGENTGKAATCGHRYYLCTQILNLSRHHPKSNHVFLCPSLSSPESFSENEPSC